MSQLMNQGMDTGSPSDSRSKRKRGRPRKDDTPPPAAEKPSSASTPMLRPLAFCTQGDESVASKGKATVKVDPDLSINDEYSNDEMVGQAVTGVLECAFDAGYFLRVRVGNSGMYMRGVVFKEGCVVPVTPENDVAPEAKMYTRQNLPIPVSFTPENDKPTEKEGDSRQESDSPVHDNVGQGEPNTYTVDNLSSVDLEKDTGIVIGDEEEKAKEKEKDLEVAEQAQNGDLVVPGGENVANKPKDQTTEAEVAQNGNQAVSGEHNVLNQIEEKKGDNDKTSELKTKEDCSERADLEESTDPPLKIQKTDEGTETLTCSNGQASNESAQLSVSANEPVEPTVAGKAILRNAGFQINMENTDASDLASEQPSEFSAMETEKVEV
ncbi:hypothetical protein vseg_011265 [Gypsophila vaccaria]